MADFFGNVNSAYQGIENVFGNFARNQSLIKHKIFNLKSDYYHHDSLEYFVQICRL